MQFKAISLLNKQKYNHKAEHEEAAVDHKNQRENKIILSWIFMISWYPIRYKGDATNYDNEEPVEGDSNAHANFSHDFSQDYPSYGPYWGSKED